MAPVGAVLLAGGLAARFVAAALFVTMVAAGMMRAGPPELVYWLMVLGLICLHGAGPLALDELVYRRLRTLFPQLDGKPAFSLADAPHVVLWVLASAGLPRRGAYAGAEPGSP